MNATATRMSAAERREQILDAAVEEIALQGFRSATTAAIAARAGISQPYVFRFFPTKKDLALAVIERSSRRILADWEAAEPLPGEGRLETLGRTYVERLTSRRPELLVQLHGYAAGEDPDVAEAARACWTRIYRYVVSTLRAEGNPDPEAAASAFMARGMVITMAMAIGLESDLTKTEWASLCSKSGVARVEDRLGPSGAPAAS
ncbi:MAG TPA: TetR/AcrR family transcriptional regulator [Miltoncostaeaceae bacterium]|nr:TetR/AcrR family transcriptional regulator [Miltoncostaeaceae bacterium]